MVWTRAKSYLFIAALSFLSVASANAQESLWKTFNPFPDREVPTYSGGLSPFPQKQEKIDEVEFEETSAPISDIETIEADVNLTDQEKRLMLTTSILAEIKAFLSEESVFIPNLDKVVVEAVARADGQYRALIARKWRVVGDEMRVPVDEAKGALDLLDRLREVDEQIAETVESAVMERTHGKGEEVIKISDIESDRVLFTGSDGQEYVVNFIKAPF
jgi:hypothetical protein